MKRCFLCLFLIISCTSCKNTWDSETRNMFKQSCVEEATWAASPQQANKYCDCVLERMMDKYPQFSDAMDHIQEISADSSIQACRQSAK